MRRIIRRAPATLKSWHGLPPQMMSTGNNSLPFNFVMSPLWAMHGKRRSVTFMGNDSISLAQSVLIPYRSAARGKPPMPSKRLPMVRGATPWTSPSPLCARVPWTVFPPR